MMELYILVVLISVLWFRNIDSQNITTRNFIFKQYNYDTPINVVLNDTTEQVLSFYEDSSDLNGYPRRVHVSGDDTINSNYPLFITATQQRGISSWELPLVVRTRHSVTCFNDMARTLCPHNAGPTTTSENRPLIQLTTSNPANVSVNITVTRIQDFYVKFDKEVTLEVTPSTPKYYYFSFDTMNHNYVPPQTVILIIESPDDTCAIVSIQNNSCPVFDNESEQLYQGHRLTMTTKGGITISQSKYPVGFYVVFIVKHSDEKCIGTTPDIHTNGTTLYSGKDNARMKKFTFRIIATISYFEYAMGAIMTLLLIALIAALGIAVFYIPPFTCSGEVLPVEDGLQPVTARDLPNKQEPTINAGTSREVLLVEDDPHSSTSGDRPNEQEPMINAGTSGDDSAPDARQYGTFAVNRGRSVTLSPLGSLTVADLSTESNRRYSGYCRTSLTVAVVYALPVVQLLTTYQHMVSQTGNQDLCYYNFLCAHPLGFLSDFNHVFSNVGYVILGFVFMYQTRIRAKASRMRPPDVGIPQHYALFYSMGLALLMEGVLSACYHLCPNKMNFQFDLSFMYVIAALCLVTLYQNRHGDVNATSHCTFMVIALIMTIGLCGIMWPEAWFWSIFTVAHLLICFALTIKIYYVSTIDLNFSLVTSAWGFVKVNGRQAFVPIYVARFVLLVMANLVNWGLAGYGLYARPEFPVQLLSILLGNMALYLIFYIVMKYVHKETIHLLTWVYFILAFGTWIWGLILFWDYKTQWEVTPAKSRQRNSLCSVASLTFEFYDSHDFWHLVSAAAVFFSFNVLLTVDDGLVDTPRKDMKNIF